jgi:hypothetical protein
MGGPQAGALVVESTAQAGQESLSAEVPCSSSPPGHHAAVSLAQQQPSSHVAQRWCPGRSAAALAEWGCNAGGRVALAGLTLLLSPARDVCCCGCFTG